MARLIIGSQLFSDSGDAVQIISAKNPRVQALTLKARPGNAESIYVFSGDDSTGGANAYEILPGDREDWQFDPPTTNPAQLWFWAGDSGDRLDYVFLMEE